MHFYRGILILNLQHKYVSNCKNSSRWEKFLGRDVFLEISSNGILVPIVVFLSHNVTTNNFYWICIWLESFRILREKVFSVLKTFFLMKMFLVLLMIFCEKLTFPFLGKYWILLHIFQKIIGSCSTNLGLAWKMSNYNTLNIVFYHMIHSACFQEISNLLMKGISSKLIYWLRGEKIKKTIQSKDSSSASGDLSSPQRPLTGSRKICWYLPKKIFWVVLPNKIYRAITLLTGSLNLN